ncbi:peptidase inhibitor family I36 protein [Actinoplanes sp. NBC_00393]|uniref:peptidase inhibitor family I36 protein n=1 Tax=Actinoplanes sp. NBC_00393 TaxID=2975953 RepID=UPI002E1CB3B7
MNRILALGIATVMAGAGVAVASPAQAAPAGCRPGYFCIYKHINYNPNYVYYASGRDRSWTNDEFQDQTPVLENDSSWFNNGIVAPGIPTYVQVHDREDHVGAMTICLRAGTGFPRKPASSDRGRSHRWTYGC